MRIQCPCGASVHDITDNLSYKAHFVADQDRGDYWDAITAAILHPGATEEERRATFYRVRRLVCDVYRPAWVCRDCGRVFIYDQRDRFQQFVPASESSAADLSAVAATRANRTPNQTPRRETYRWDLAHEQVNQA